jgi:putative nucleotidyltransferase with HDIG domain
VTLGEMGLARRVDSLLFPLGLLAAIAAADAPAGALLVLALVPLLVGFGREREASIERSLELGRAYRGTALLLRDLLEEDDEYTGHHTEDVVVLSVKVAEQMRVDEDTLRATEMGALLHDIGKIGISDAILTKPSALTDDEFEAIKRHTSLGAQILQPISFLAAHVPIVELHHERPDGTGYPHGLCGDAIPIHARIVHVADAFDAMTTARAYRGARPATDAVGELWRGAGTDFDVPALQGLASVVAQMDTAALTAAPQPPFDAAARATDSSGAATVLPFERAS